MIKQHRLLQAMVLIAVQAMIASDGNAAEILYAENDERHVRVAVVGEIEKGDFDKVSTLIAKAIPSDEKNDMPMFGIEIYSNGGDVIEASRIGAMARELFIATSVPGLTNGSCGVVSDAQRRLGRLSRFRWWPASADPSLACGCYSACFVAWAGGVNRYGGTTLGEETLIGIHRARFGSEYFSGLSSREADILYDELLEDLNSYLARMDVPSSVVERMNNTPSSEMYMLSRAELESIGRFPPSMDEWLESKCVDKRLTQQESADLDELNVKWAAIITERGPELSSPESNYRLTLDIKLIQYSKCRRNAWSVEQAKRIREYAERTRS